jgi:phosphoglycolate phosphatase
MFFQGFAEVRPEPFPSTEKGCDIICLMPIKLILFDLDGTLVDTGKDITDALNYALRPCGSKSFTVDETKKLVGEGVTRLMEKALGQGDAGLRDTVMKRFLDYYSAHITDNSELYPFVGEILKKFDGFRKAIISNKREDLSVKLLEKLDILKYFDLVVGSDTAPERKPSPVPVAYALSKLGVKAPEAVIVGDSSYDIEAGKKAGITTIAVTYGYGEKHYLLGADYTIDSIKDLSLILDISSSELI